MLPLFDSDDRRYCRGVLEVAQTRNEVPLGYVMFELHSILQVSLSSCSNLSGILLPSFP